MVLESDIECLSKAIHVIVFSVKPDFYIGRRINNDITISDISVSRKQAGIILRPNGKVYVEDCNSKFGTFVKVNGAIPIPKTHTLPIQIEKKIFFFKLEQRFSCFQLCLISCGLPVKTSAEGKTLKEEQHEHYHEVIDKFPEELEQLFFPPLPPQYGNQSHTVPVKPNES